MEGPQRLASTPLRLPLLESELWLLEPTMQVRAQVQPVQRGPPLDRPTFSKVIRVVGFCSGTRERVKRVRNRRQAGNAPRVPLTILTQKQSISLRGGVRRLRRAHRCASFNNQVLNRRDVSQRRWVRRFLCTHGYARFHRQILIIRSVSQRRRVRRLRCAHSFIPSLRHLPRHRQLRHLPRRDVGFLFVLTWVGDCKTNFETFCAAVLMP